VGTTARPIIDHIQAQDVARIVALGSSNTERAAHSQARFNWFDWLDYGLRLQYGRRHHCINAGVCGETTTQLAARFERDVALYQPHLVFLTVGGNDSAPDKCIPPDTFAAQLAGLVSAAQALGNCRCILQTYYSVHEQKVDATHFRQFHEYMHIVRTIAMERGADLIDNLERWEHIRLNHYETYLTLMYDPFHVSPLGNMLWGLDVCRYCGVDVAATLGEWCAEGLRLQEMVDKRV
jgi:lysophospholipase L1-like esterase